MKIERQSVSLHRSQDNGKPLRIEQRLMLILFDGHIFCSSRPNYKRSPMRKIKKALCGVEYHLVNSVYGDRFFVAYNLSN